MPLKFGGFILLMVTQCLPKEELYAPPLNIRIFDKRNFGRLPLVGTHVIKSLKDFHVKPDLSAEQNAAVQGGEEGGGPSRSSAGSGPHVCCTITLFAVLLSVNVGRVHSGHAQLI